MAGSPSSSSMEGMGSVVAAGAGERPRPPRPRPRAARPVGGRPRPLVVARKRRKNGATIQMRVASHMARNGSRNCGMAARTTSSGSLPSTAGLFASCARAGPVRNGRHLNIRPWPRRRAAKGATRSTLAADRSSNSSGDHVDPFGFRSCRVRVMVPCGCPFMPCCAHAVQGPPIGLRCARDVARAGWPWSVLTRV